MDESNFEFSTFFKPKESSQNQYKASFPCEMNPDSEQQIKAKLNPEQEEDKISDANSKSEASVDIESCSSLSSNFNDEVEICEDDISSSHSADHNSQNDFPTSTLIEFQEYLKDLKHQI